MPKIPSILKMLMSKIIRVILVYLFGVAAIGSSFNLGNAAVIRTYIVDTYLDDGNLMQCTDAPNDCSLRGAIHKSNKTTLPDTIILPKGIYNLAGDINDNQNISGDLDILEDGGNLTIIGEGAEATVISAEGNDRVVDSGGFGSIITVTLRHLTLKKGNPGSRGDGGAIKTYSNIILENVIITENVARTGAGIFIFALSNRKLTISNTTFSNNHATETGGGLYAGGVFTNISFSAFVNNSAVDYGGAIMNNGQLNLTSSTIFGNRAGDGGGLMNWTSYENITTNINNATFSHNTNAISNHANYFLKVQTVATINLRNSIIANSSSGTDCYQDNHDYSTAVIIDSGNSFSTGVDCSLNTVLGSVNSIDPMLEEPADNGGLTPTMALKEGSPAINSGYNTSCSPFDQRGLPSIGKCDSGAYEFGARPVLFATGGVSRTQKNGDQLGSPLSVLVTNSLGNPLVGWRVDFVSENDSIVNLSPSMVRTYDDGKAAVTARVNDFRSSPVMVTATAGATRINFNITSQSSQPRSYSSGSGGATLLPATGFPANVITTLPNQPLEKKYTNKDSLVLEIPKLGIKIPIVGIPQTDDGWDLSWLFNQAGYLEGTAFPTWKGNSAITSHVYLSDGKPGPFVHLHTLSFSDEIIIHGWGDRYIYQVTEVKTVSATDIGVLKPENKTLLTLITCQGFDPVKNNYLNRVVVKGVLTRIYNGN